MTLRPAGRTSYRCICGRLAALGCALLLACCGKGTTPAENAREFTVRGMVRGLSPDGRTLEVEHEAVPNYMPSMTMPFSLRNPTDAKEVKVGDAISFRLRVTETEAFIDRIEKIHARELELPVRAETKPAAETSLRLRAGDMMPPFQFTNEQGEKLTAETFRGRPYVLTFIFTRCPIPNFCPLMNRNFGELQSAIKGGSGALATTRLLSISFDPDFDTPEVLKQTSTHEGADPAVWNFATGEKPEIERLTQGFSVLVQPEGGTISHGLATALVDGEGRIVEIWRGNGWKPAEVAEKIASL